MSVNYKKLFHLMIEENISNAQLVRNARIPANIITKLKNGQCIALDQMDSICAALNCTPNDILEFPSAGSARSGGLNDV